MYCSCTKGKSQEILCKVYKACLFRISTIKLIDVIITHDVKFDELTPSFQKPIIENVHNENSKAMV